jgi:poly(3-hydroxybutyrate) depolymerase
MTFRILPLLTVVAISAGSACAQPDAAESAKTVQEIQNWLKLARDKRPAIPDAIARVALTKADAATVTKALWDDHVAALKAERAEEMKAKVLTFGDKKMKYEVVKFGSGGQGQPLFISMHGGGGAPAEVNESQWANQIKLAQAYKPKAGLYVAPRAPTDTWNLWHEGHMDTLFARLIENMVAVEGVDPNRVYLMGYSAGGDGTYELTPRMADRFAAASMMAGHPNSVSPLGLRNVPFTIHVGAEDGGERGYHRNEKAAEFGKKLDDLQKADPGGYEHWVHIHEGRSHWMNMEDKEAIPWMEKHTRNPIPDKIVWHQSGVTHDHYYWLAIPKEDAKGGQDITAERSGQAITVNTRSNPHVTVLLNDTVLDMDQPVTVTWNGKTLEPRRVDRTIAVIRRTLEERGDPFLTFSAEMTLPPP